MEMEVGQSARIETVSFPEPGREGVSGIQALCCTGCSGDASRPVVVAGRMLPGWRSHSSSLQGLRIFPGRETYTAFWGGGG